MSINELQDMVIDALQVSEEEDEGETRRGAEIFFRGTGESVSYDVFLRDAEETKDNIFALEADEILYRVASLAARSQILSPHVYSFPNSSVQLLYHAIDFKESGEKDNLSSIQDHLTKMIADHNKGKRAKKIRDATGSQEMVLDILEAVWGEDTEANLIEVGRVKKATVKRWLSGSNIGSSAYSRLLYLAKIFYLLREDKGYSRDDLAHWYDAPLSDGQTPRQSLAAAPWGLPTNIRDFMSKMDISLY